MHGGGADGGGGGVGSKTEEDWSERRPGAAEGALEVALSLPVPVAFAPVAFVPVASRQSTSARFSGHASHASGQALHRLKLHLTVHGR